MVCGDDVHPGQEIHQPVVRDKQDEEEHPAQEGAQDHGADFGDREDSVERALQEDETVYHHYELITMTDISLIRLRDSSLAWESG